MRTKAEPPNTQGLESGVQGLGFRVLGFRVLGFRVLHRVECFVPFWWALFQLQVLSESRVRGSLVFGFGVLMFLGF